MVGTRVPVLFDNREFDVAKIRNNQQTQTFQEFHFVSQSYSSLLQHSE